MYEQVISNKMCDGWVKPFTGANYNLIRKLQTFLKKKKVHIRVDNAAGELPTT